MMRKVTLWAVVFLVLLRLTIGWQFLMEGLQKVRSNYLIGPSETSKPFSSEGYFRGSTGPFASLIRGQLPDPDEQILAYTKLQPLPAEADRAKINPADRMPVALGQVWDAYLEAFIAHYRPNSDQVKLAQQRREQDKADYVRWLEQEKKEVTRKVSGNDVAMTLTTRYRIEEFERALQEFREFDRKRWLMFREVDKDDYALARARVLELRTALAKDVDEQTDRFKKGLARIIRQKIDESLVLPKLDADLEKELPALLTLAPRGEKDLLSAAIPTALDARWKEYSTSLQEHLKVDEKQKKTGDRLLDRAREQTVLWMMDTEVQGPRASALVGLVAVNGPLLPLQLTGTVLAWNHLPPGPADRIAQLTTASGLTTEEKQKLRESLAADLTAQTNRMKAGLEDMLSETQKNVTVPRPVENWTFIKTLDFITICVITGAGALLLLGLLTRTACVLAAGFLLLTFLSAPPFPWLPMPPGTEGNPVYVNKNLIEFMALLALAGTASGRWAGLDGLLAWMRGVDDEDESPVGEAEPGPAGSAPPATPVPVVQVKTKNRQ